MATRGRPFEPGNKMGRGRPRGSRNKVSAESRQLLEEYAAPLMRQAIAQALKSGGPVLRLLITQILGPPKPSPVAIGNLRTETAADVSKASQVVLRKATKGEITPQEAQDMAALLETRRRAIETEGLEKRLQKLESQK